jgi:SAM-dependent methyltransferase
VVLREALATGLPVLATRTGGAPVFHSFGANGAIYEQYYGGRPAVDQVEIKPYASVRAAWADLLRGQVDVLYDVGVDALDSLEMSKDVKVYEFPRGYAFMLLLNLRKPSLQDPALRRALNDAIDRESLVSEIFRSHGTAATGPVWPQNWAYDKELPKFSYQPRLIDERGKRLKIKCLFGDASHERLAIAVQRELQAIGVDLELEMLPGSQLFARVQSGDFEAILADAIQGPNLVPPYLFWHSQGPFNWGHYANPQVDAALDSIRHAADDAQYKAGVAAFQHAIVDDPPAVLRELARVVRPGGTIAGLEFAVPRGVWRPLWELYVRAGLPLAGRAISPGWAEVGDFLGPSIRNFYAEWPEPRLVELWRAAGIADVSSRRLSLGGGIVTWGRRA